MSDLAEKILEAIGAKEVLALATTSLKWKTHDTHIQGRGQHCAAVLNDDYLNDPRPLVAWLPTFENVGWHVPGPWANATFIADNDPASVLRDCAADREIVELYVKVRNDETRLSRIAAGPSPMVESDRKDWEHLREVLPYLSAVVASLARGYGLEVEG